MARPSAGIVTAQTEKQNAATGTREPREKEDAEEDEVGEEDARSCRTRVLSRSWPRCFCVPGLGVKRIYRRDDRNHVALTGSYSTNRYHGRRARTCLLDASRILAQCLSARDGSSTIRRLVNCARIGSKRTVSTIAANRRFEHLQLASDPHETMVLR